MQFPSHGQPVNATLPSACTAELAVHVDYTAADTKVYLHIDPFTLLIPSWVMLSVLTHTEYSEFLPACSHHGKPLNSVTWFVMVCS